MAELKYSKSGVPYIKIPMGKIIFGKTLKTRKGYKWFTYSYNFTSQVHIGAGRNVSVSSRDSIIFDQTFQNLGNTFPIKLRNKLKTIFTSLTDEGYLAEKNISLLGDILKNINFEEIYNPKPKRKYKKRKRK